MLMAPKSSTYYFAGLVMSGMRQLIFLLALSIPVASLGVIMGAQLGRMSFVPSRFSVPRTVLYVLGSSCSGQFSQDGADGNRFVYCDRGWLRDSGIHQCCYGSRVVDGINVGLSTFINASFLGVDSLLAHCRECPDDGRYANVFDSHLGGYDPDEHSRRRDLHAGLSFAMSRAGSAAVISTRVVGLIIAFLVGLLTAQTFSVAFGLSGPGAATGRAI
ncbi:MAG: hypothetical protein R2688_06475 [Fimbriimonadaceae bacterium]